MKYAIVIIVFLIGCKSEFKAKITKVIDGDSYYIDAGKEVRLYGCDAPENTLGHNQNYGINATLFARHYLEGKTVTLKKMSTDKYNRLVCIVFIDDNDFSDMLVSNGLAWVYKKYGSDKLLNELLEADWYPENTDCAWTDIAVFEDKYYAVFGEDSVYASDAELIYVEIEPTPGMVKEFEYYQQY